MEGISSEFSPFDLPPTHTGIENIRMENVQPTSTISENSSILFDIYGQNGMEYLDLMKSQMYVKLRVKHEDGTKLLDGEDVASVNFLAIPVFTDRRQHTRQSAVIDLWLLPI